MRSLPLHELAALPRAEALQRWRDERNAAVVRPLLWGFAPIALVMTIVEASRGDLLRAGGSAMTLALLAGGILGLRRDRWRHGFHPALLTLLAAGFTLWMVITTLFPMVMFASIFLSPLLLLLLRLRGSDTPLLAVGAAGVAGIRILAGGLEEAPDSFWGPFIGIVLVNAVAAWAGWAMTRRQAGRFIAEWSVASSRERESSRMREELEDARAIQLAMLPSSAPDVSWLELQGMSLPATEVGGDYYDFLPVDGDRVAVVVGDVAGHGVASGLLLSGVRAGLHLLRADLAEPRAVVERLNLLVRDSGVSRLFMSLVVALFDRKTGQVHVVTAGHPPALRFCAATGKVSAIEASSPPLGTRLPAAFPLHTEPLEPGDLWLFVTDGLLEATDPRGRPYGERRLMDELAAAARRDPRPRAVEQALLADLATYRGESELQDDLTVVVVRVVPSAGA
ncbi:MAG: SpoIIE family protein phosphatase [Thermoanaerobaculia bacterium]|nr:SpoIIE family protein phosphatase [Thermoanaerobaculia bacterium]MBP9824841.1 SpoIIE family protein phosphatase [Thermoanaerobaculia bacterium]